MELKHYHKPHKVEKPWGYEIWWANTREYLGKHLFIKAGHCSSVHYHRDKNETMYVHVGIAKIEIYELEGGKRIDYYTLGPGESIDIPAGVVHCIMALSDLDLFESSTPHPDDSIRVLDPYKRDEK